VRPVARCGKGSRRDTAKQIEEGDDSTQEYIWTSTVYEVSSLRGALENLAALLIAVASTIWNFHTRAAVVQAGQSLASKARF
jgi:hypothetical protein